MTPEAWTILGVGGFIALILIDGFGKLHVKADRTNSTLDEIWQKLNEHWPKRRDW